jgi:hypothetical protein
LRGDPIIRFIIKGPKEKGKTQKPKKKEQHKNKLNKKGKIGKTWNPKKKKRGRT